MRDETSAAYARRSRRRCGPDLERRRDISLATRCQYDVRRGAVLLDSAQASVGVGLDQAVRMKRRCGGAAGITPTSALFFEFGHDRSSEIDAVGPVDRFGVAD